MHRFNRLYLDGRFILLYNENDSIKEVDSRDY